MNTSVNLQDSFTYSLIPLAIFIILIIIETVCLICTRKKKGKTEKIKVEEIPEKNKKDIPVIKSKYLEQLNTISSKYENNVIELRIAYQLISEAVRMFVFEVTDITTQNYTLTEIKKLNIPSLYELIEEYYEPEFASKSVGDFDESINKARRIINEWN